MYAVIETGGKQYRVEVGTELEVELLDGAAGDSVTLDRVLLVADGDTAAIGRPIVANATVAAEVVRRARGDKVISFKYRPKARRRVKKGHRQELTVLRIRDIVLDGRSAAAEAAKVAEAKITERQRLEDAARRQAEADAALAAKLTPAAAPKPARGRAAKAEPGATAQPKASGRPGTKASSTGSAAKSAKSADTTAKPAGRGRATASSSKAEADDAAAKPADVTEKPRRSRAAKKDE